MKVLTEEECDRAQEEMFQDFNDAKSQVNGPIKKDDPLTWDTRNWPSNGKFLLTKCCFGQYAMNNRTHPGTRGLLALTGLVSRPLLVLYEIFRRIYKTDALWSSLDKWGVMRGTVNIPQMVDGNIVHVRCYKGPFHRAYR